MKNIASSTGTILLGILGGVLSHVSLGAVHADPPPKVAEDATFKTVRAQKLELVTSDGLVVGSIGVSENKGGYVTVFWLGTPQDSGKSGGFSMVVGVSRGDEGKGDPVSASPQFNIYNDFDQKRLSMDSCRIGVSENFGPVSERQGKPTSLSIEPTGISSRHAQTVWALRGDEASGSRLMLYDFNGGPGISLFTPNKEGEKARILVYDDKGEPQTVQTK